MPKSILKTITRRATTSITKAFFFSKISAKKNETNDLKMPFI